MRLITYNYAQLNETVISASSENVNFPSTNIRHEHRSKEWRSKGNFLLDSSNNRIVFDEGAGELTAILSEGSYSVAQLISEIKNKLETIGNNQYLAKYSESLCIWSVESNFEVTLLSSSTFLEVIGFNSIDLIGTTFIAPRPAIHTHEHVVFDLKTTEEIDSVILLWGREQYKLTENAQVRIQASATANFSTPSIDQEIILDNDFEISSFYFDNPQSYRFWRVVIKDPNNPRGFVNLGVVILGKSEVTDVPDNGFSFSLYDSSTISRTEFGQEYSDIYPILSQLDLDFGQMESDVAEKMILLYRRIGTRVPVFIALDPMGEAFRKDCYAIYGKFPSSLAQKQSFFTIFSTGLSIREVN